MDYLVKRASFSIWKRLLLVSIGSPNRYKFYRAFLEVLKYCLSPEKNIILYIIIIIILFAKFIEFGLFAKYI